MRKITASPSLMCMDLLHAGDQLQILDRHFDALHFDIMDGHFCPNITLSPDLLKAVCAASPLPVDVHLMTTDPALFIPEAAKAGSKWISVHAETVNSSAFRTFDMISSLGCMPGLVLNPATTLESVKYMLGRIDLLTIMTVDPGFAGQKFIPEMIGKIKEAAALRDKNGWHYKIQIDGSCRKATYKSLIEAGADMLILGSSGLFSLSDDLDEACRTAKADIAAACEGL